MNRTRTLLLVVFAAFLGGSAAHAQSIEDRLRQQYQATLEQLHQLQDQQAGLQAAKASAEQERDALKKQLATAQAAVAHAKRVVVPDTSAYEENLAKYKEALTQASDSVNKSGAERDAAKAAIERQKTVLAACEAKNEQLVKVSNEILDAYKNSDLLDAVESKEPFVGSKRVELENVAQDFGDRIYDGKFDPRTVRPAKKPDPKTNAPPPQKSTSDAH